MHDCCIRVIYNMVTALLEYLNLKANPAYDYSIKEFPSLQCKIDSQTTNFTYFPRILFFAFSFLIFQKFCWENWDSPNLKA